MAALRRLSIRRLPQPALSQHHLCRAPFLEHPLSRQLQVADHTKDFQSVRQAPVPHPAMR